MTKHGSLDPEENILPEEKPQKQPPSHVTYPDGDVYPRRKLSILND